MYTLTLYEAYISYSQRSKKFYITKCTEMKCHDTDSYGSSMSLSQQWRHMLQYTGHRQMQQQHNTTAPISTALITTMPMMPPTLVTAAVIEFGSRQGHSIPTSNTSHLPLSSCPQQCNVSVSTVMIQGSK